MYKRAAANFREALRLQPDVPEGWYNLGFVLLALERREEGSACFREALRLRPDYPLAKLALIRGGGGTP